MTAVKLLVVDDNVPNLELMTEVFTSMQAEVHPFSDSMQAARTVNQQKFEGIVLDLKMPQMHGFDLTRMIRKSSWNKSTPIIVLTGDEDKHSMQQAFAAGASFFLQKPIDRQKLGKLFRTVRGGLIESRRRQTRVPLQTEVVCEVGSRTMRGRTWNLSQGGIQIEASNLQAGDAVQLSFRLPVADIPVEAVGVVAWANEERQGIQFTGLNPRSREAIQEFIAATDK